MSRTRQAEGEPAPLQVASAGDACDPGDPGEEPNVAHTVDTAELLIARLEGRVAALEAALERRSRELRLLQRHLCQRDLAQWARLEVGLPPLPLIAHQPEFWRETKDLTYAEVPETLLDLWASLYPRAAQQ